MNAAITLRLAALTVLAALTASTRAADQASVAVGTTAIGSTAPAAQLTDRNGLTPLEVWQAQVWGLTPAEMQRATMLLKGPRATFSVATLSPVEALGIHARTPAERRKYAELFVRAFHQDVERVLAWNQAADEALRRLYPNEPVISFDNVSKVAADPAVAAGANIPRSLLVPGGAKAGR